MSFSHFWPFLFLEPHHFLISNFYGYPFPVQRARFDVYEQLEILSIPDFCFDDDQKDIVNVSAVIFQVGYDGFASFKLQGVSIKNDCVYKTIDVDVGRFVD